ncbi:MAG: hypothetical protein V7746_02475 [Halioglobus sp.]
MTSNATPFQMDLRQTVKLVVYALLLVNFALYIADDIRVASYTMRNGGSFLDWTSAFTTTIDESAWFILLLLFELETYVLSDEIQRRPGVLLLVHGMRLLCYASLTHSVYAFGLTYLDISQVTAINGVSDLCQYVGTELSFVRNLEYTDINAITCNTLSNANEFFFTEPDLVVTDASGLALETRLALVDVLEVLVWLSILFTIEVMVWLQDRDITRSKLITGIKWAKTILYTSLWCAAAYWASLGHWYFAWDEALWIVGFFAIEMNVSEWKKEIEETQTETAESI